MVLFVACGLYAQAQSWSWASAALGERNEIAMDVTTHPTRPMVYHVGVFDSVLTNLPNPNNPLVPTVPNGLIVVTDTAGVYIDHTIIRSASPIELEGVVVDGEGSIYITGSFEFAANFQGNNPGPGMLLTAPAGSRHLFVAKLDSNLQGVWAFSDSLASACKGYGIDLEGNRLVVVGGYEGTLGINGDTIGNAGNWDAFIVEVNSTTAQNYWLTGIGGADADEAFAVDAGYLGVYVGGYFSSLTLGHTGPPVFTLTNSATGTPDAFVAAMRMDSGQVRWGASAGGAGEDVCRGVDADFSQVYAVGDFTAPASFGAAGTLTGSAPPDAFLWALDRGTGTGLWARAEDGPGTDCAYDVDADGIGNVFVTGSFQGTILLGGSSSQTAAGTNAIFLTAYDPAGNFSNWSLSAGNADNSLSSALHAGRWGTYIAGRYFLSQLNFQGGAVSLNAFPNENFFSARLGCGNWLNTLPNLVLSQDTVCAGDSVSITLSNSSPNAFYALVEHDLDTVIGTPVAGVGGPLVLWTGPLNSSIAIDVVAVSPSGLCFELLADTFFVAMVGAPTPDLGPDTTLCAGDSVLLDPGAFATYSWSTGQVTPTLWVMAADTYYVTVKNNAACPGADTVVINVQNYPTVSVRDTAVCPGTVVGYSVNIPGAAILWSTGSTSMAVSIPDTGNYWVEASFGPCAARDTFRIFPLPVPAIDLGPDDSVCIGGTKILDAGSGFATYAWSTGDATTFIQVDSSGTYAVTVSNVVNCFAADTMNFTVLPLPVVTVTGIPAMACDGDAPYTATALPLGGTMVGPFNGLVFDPGAVGIGAYNFTYIYTDPFGCTDSTSGAVTVEASPSAADAGPDQTIQNASTQLQAVVPASGVGYWSLPSAGTMSDDSIPDPIVSGLVPGTYIYFWNVTSPSCGSTQDAVVITVEQELFPIRIPTGFSPNGDGVNDTWEVENLLNYATRKVKIFNRWGTVVYASDAYNNDWDGEELSDDTYYYTLDMGEYGNFSGYVVLKR